MRRALCLAAIAALALPASALAIGLTSGDGTLSVRDGDGFVFLSLRGAMIGRLGSGTLEIEVPVDRDCDSLTVWGAEDSGDWLRQREVGLVTVCRFAGRGIRFRVATTAPQTIRMRRARALDFSAVGRGVGFIRGAGGVDGTYSVDGAAYASLPDDGERVVFGE